MIYFKKRRMKKEKESQDPFERYHPTCIIQCKDDSTFERLHKRFEYVGQTVEEGVIIGIYVNYEMTEKEKKYEKLCKKWR